MITEKLEEMIKEMKAGHYYRADYEHDRYIQIRHNRFKDKFEIKIEEADIFDKPMATYYYFIEGELINYLSKYYESIGAWRIY